MLGTSMAGFHAKYDGILHKVSWQGYSMPSVARFLVHMMGFFYAKCSGVLDTPSMGGLKITVY